MSGHPRLIRLTPRYLDPQATCGLPRSFGSKEACGGKLSVRDWRPDGDKPGWRYELYCTKCNTCDPNGYGTQEGVMGPGLDYFDAKATTEKGID